MTFDMDRPGIQKISYDCLLRLQSVYGSLKRAEKKAADYLLAQPESFAQDSIVEVAAKAGCSEATLVRLGQRLDYNGYAEMKAAVLSNAEDRVCLYENIQPEDSGIAVLHKVFQSSVQSILDTRKLLDAEAYQRAVDVLRQAKKIQFLGIGDASIVALAGYHKFFRLGIDARYSDDYDMNLMIAAQLTRADAIVVISHSGNTETTLRVLKCAKEVGATSICITNSPMSPIGKQADILLLTAAFGHQMMGEAMTKRIPSLCIVESLYMNTLMQISQQQAEILEISTRALMHNKI